MGTGGDELAGAVYAQLVRATVLANALGALVVGIFLAFLLPVTAEPGQVGKLAVRGAVVGAVYLSITLPLGLAWARRHEGGALLRWLQSGRPASGPERDLALRYALTATKISAVFWTLAAGVLTLASIGTSVALSVATAVTVLLGGVTTCAVIYLLYERILRPVIALALAGGPPPRAVAPGITARMTMAWTLATGVPVLGVAAVVLVELVGADVDERAIAAAALFLAVLALVVGWLAIAVAARSVAEPVASVRAAMGRIEQGQLDCRVEVDDGSEVGLLQAGFNRMAEGLAERERLHDLFGRHVGRDVAQAALAREVELGGELREVAVLFVDLIGSTALAARRPPEEVVSLLNAFFAIVVETVEARGGWINKFEGDAALAVFGAPTERTDAAGDALAAARELRGRLGRELPELDAGIGVSAGSAVAGNVGAEQRYEYTVIGDPVNEAARLCELAKRRPERLLASGAALELAGPGERRRWERGDAVTLRGRDQPTRLATPTTSGRAPAEAAP